MHVLACALVVLLAFAAPAAAADARVTLAGSDDLVLRTIQVTTASGPLPPLMIAKSFDRGAKVFVFEDFTGRPITVRAADVRGMTVFRSARASNPVVQMPLQQVTATSEGVVSVTVPAAQLLVDQNVLTVSGPEVPPLETGVRWELRSLRYVPATQAFAIELERVRYTVTMSGGGGGGGSSGMRKGMP